MGNIYSTSWSEVGHSVFQLNPSLFKVIDSYPKLKKHDLKIFKYNYGDLVGDDKFFYPPSCGKSALKRIPFSMVLKSYFEMPIKIEGSSIPWKILKPGDIFPHTRFIPSNLKYEPSKLLSMYAGIKSSFLLINKISDKKWHNLLCKKFNIEVAPPTNFHDHFNVFKSLVDSCRPDWSAELLVFSEDFFDAAKKNHDFRELVFDTSLSDKLFRSNIHSYDLLLSNIYRNSHTITSAFVRECIQKIIYTACGDIPTYFPSVDDKSAPSDFIINAYIEGFRSKSCPVLMSADFFLPLSNQKKGYFSLNNLDYLYKPEKLPSQSKVIKDIINGYNKISQMIKKSSFSHESIFFQAATSLNLSPILKGDQKQSIHLLNDEQINNVLEKYKLPAPINSTFLSSTLQMFFS